MSFPRFDKPLRERIEKAANAQGYRLLTLAMCHKHYVKLGADVPISCALRQLCQDKNGVITFFQGDFSPRLQNGEEDEDDDDDDSEEEGDGDVTIRLDGRLVMLRQDADKIRASDPPYFPRCFDVVEKHNWLAENSLLPTDMDDFEFHLGGIVTPDNGNDPEMKVISLDTDGDPNECGCNMFVRCSKWNGDEPIERSGK